MAFEEKIWEALRKVGIRKKVQVKIVPNPKEKMKVVTAEIDDEETYQFYIRQSREKTTIYVYEKNMSARHADEYITISEGEKNAFITYCEMFRNYAGEIINFLRDKRTK